MQSQAKPKTTYLFPYIISILIIRILSIFSLLDRLYNLLQKSSILCLVGQNRLHEEPQISKKKNDSINKMWPKGGGGGMALLC